MKAGLRIGVVKPDWGVGGGFERLLDRLLAHLRERAHRPEVVPVDARGGVRDVWGIPVEAEHWQRHPELFGYLSLLERTRALELDRFDVVLSTQPPSFLAPHPRRVALFYHQARIFYDLCEPWLQAGFGDPVLHAEAVAAVRDVDRAHLGGVVCWLAGSRECAGRLEEYWGIVDGPEVGVRLFQAGPDLASRPEPPPYRADGPVVCVSRHEWPKRTELVVAAAHLLDGVRVAVLGGGGRLPVLRSLDVRMARGELDPAAATAADLWANRGHTDPGFVEVVGTGRPGLDLAGEVSARRRDRAYATAGVVVAPAYREDYGLTAVEAMAWGRPVVVCSDGGGLVELVEGTGAGLVVEPSASAIAEAVCYLREDPATAVAMSARAREVAAGFTWSRAYASLDTAIKAAMDTPAQAAL